MNYLTVYFKVLRPLLFNIYLNNFYLLDINICNFNDHKTPFVCNQAFETVLETLDRNLEIPIFWFENNTNKCYLLISGQKYEQRRTEIREGSDDNILGVTTDYKPNFDGHIAHFYLKANQKLCPLNH